MGREHSLVVKHPGIVKEVREKYLLISILNQTACSSCHSSGACSVADMKEKEIEITEFSRSYTPGQQVTILFKESSGFYALFLGYILPFIILFLTLIISLKITHNEGISGIISLLILIPYYITLYFFRHLLKKMFKFEIEELG